MFTVTLQNPFRIKFINTVLTLIDLEAYVCIARVKTLGMLKVTTRFFVAIRRINSLFYKRKVK